MPEAWLGSALARIPGSAAATGRSAKFAESRRMPATLRPLALLAELPLIDNRKQHVYMTRATAGGDGATGPQPEREQLA
jgi:hypothetical protein